MPSSLLLRFEHSAFLQKLHSLFRAVSSRYHPLYRSRILYLIIYYVLFIFIYNMLSSRICWSLRALSLLAKADPLSASRRLESLHLFLGATLFEDLNCRYIYFYFILFRACEIDSYVTVRALLPTRGAR